MPLSSRTLPVPITDAAEYRKLVVVHQPRLLVLDPLSAFLGNVQTSSFSRVRALLSPIIALADELDVVVVGVRHLSKASGGKAAYRGLGSIDFRAAARSVLRLGCDPRDPARQRRVLVHSKSSHCPKGASQEYEIHEGRVRWLGRSEATERDLDAPEPRRHGRTASEVASEFLTEALAAGPVRAKELKRMARREGIAWRMVQTVKTELGVLSRRRAGSGHGEGYWEWLLPCALESPAHVPEGAGAPAPDQEPDAAPLSDEGKPTPRFTFDDGDQEREDDEAPPPEGDWRPDLN